MEGVPVKRTPSRFSLRRPSGASFTLFNEKKTPSKSENSSGQLAFSSAGQSAALGCSPIEMSKQSPEPPFQVKDAVKLNDIDPDRPVQV
jgi:hypothetical protein